MKIAFDNLGNAADLIKTGLFLLFILIGPLSKLLNRGKQQSASAKPQPTRTSPPVFTRSDTPTSTPFGPLMMPSSPPPPAATRKAAPTTVWGGAFNRPADNDDATLKWGSAFDKGSGDGYGTQWKSAFDEDRDRVKWGFDDSEWGGDFGSKKTSKPKITLG